MWQIEKQASNLPICVSNVRMLQNYVEQSHQSPGRSLTFVRTHNHVLFPNSTDDFAPRRGTLARGPRRPEGRTARGECEAGEAQTKLREVEMVREANQPQPQPTPEPAMSAAELDALVEEIDECIALLKA
jgi:hypothetical protein